MKKLFKIVTVVAGITLVVIIVVPFKKLELYALYELYNKGSGLDDGATDIFMSNQQRYGAAILDLLETAEPGSYSEEVAFLFGELAMKNNESVSTKIKHLSVSHPNEETRCHWYDLVHGRYAQIPVSTKSSKVLVYRLEDTGSKCPKSP